MNVVRSIAIVIIVAVGAALIAANVRARSPAALPTTSAAVGIPEKAPPGNAIAGVEAIARLGHALDGIDRPHSADGVFAAMATEEPAFKGMSLANLGEHGVDLAAS